MRDGSQLCAERLPVMVWAVYRRKILDMLRRELS